MRPQYTLVTAPAIEPVTVDQASAHLRVDSADDLAYIEELISVGRELADSITGRVSIESTWKLIANSWTTLCGQPIGLIQLRDSTQLVNCATIHRSPLVSVESVKYIAAGASSTTTMSASDYAVITSAEPGIIQFLKALPDLADRPDAIQIEFTAGYELPELVPAGLRHAIKMMVAHIYETRTPVAFASATQIPLTLQTLLDNQKVRGWIA